MSSPARSHIGPYRIIEALGRGGMGVVYRAARVDGSQVALKTVNLAEAALLESLRREIRALARLRHPGIVRIVDEGVDDGLPWYAMDLVTGRLLRHHVDHLARQSPLALREARAPTVWYRKQAEDDWWTRSLPGGASSGEMVVQAMTGRRARPSPKRPPAAGGCLAEVLTLMRRLCSPLAYLHGEGFVHRDLKPANIIVMPDGRPVILDFGLITRFGASLAREPLDLQGLAVGTVDYVAPEQGQGDLVDARADIYALGCILYELLTGRPPFAAETPVEVLRLRYVADPLPPSELVGGIPRALDELTMRLMAREPRRRIGYAEDVASMLAQLGAEEPAAVDGPRARAYLYRAELSGRGGALDRLKQPIGWLGDERGGLLLLAGETGVGKTRLAMAAAGWAHERRVEVIMGESPPPGSDGAAQAPLQAFGAVLRAVADRCRELGAAETDRLLGPRGAVLFAYEPALRGLPGAREPVTELPADAARLRLFSVVGGVLKALGQARPVLLVLDDLQWADDLSVACLAHFVEQGLLERMAVLILGTYRSDEAGPILTDLAGQEGVQTTQVGRLDESSVAAVVGDMLAMTTPPHSLVQHVAERSEGNPFYIGEYLRLAVQEGILSRDVQGRWCVHGHDPDQEALEALGLPVSVRELVARRLDGLPEDADRLLALAAVLGRELERPLLRASGLSTDALLDGISTLMARQILKEPGPGRLRFVHDRLREVAYERIPGQDRPGLHRNAAAAIEASFGPEAEGHLPQLGLHWQKAGERERARACYLKAARQASQRYAHQEAEKLYLSHLALAREPTAEDVAARNELGGSVYLRLGRADQARALHAQARSEARQIGDVRGEAHSLRLLGALNGQQGRMAEAAQYFRESLALFESVADTAGEAIAKGNLAVALAELGQMADAGDLYEQSLALHRRSGDNRRIAAALNHLATFRARTGRLAEAQDLNREALGIQRAIGDRWAEGITLSDLAACLEDLGRYEESRRLQEEALAVHRSVGNRRLEGVTLLNSSALARAAGRLADARDLAEKARHLGVSQRDRRLEGIALLRLGDNSLDGGAVTEGSELIEAALAILGAVADRRWQAQGLMSLAGARLEQGRVPEAQGAIDGAIAIGRALGDDLGEAQGLLQAARVARLGRGDRRSAQALLTKARQMLTRIGGTGEQVVLLCEGAHLALMGGRSAQAKLALAQRRVKRSAPSQAARVAVAQLERACAAFAEGRELHHGQCLSDVPEGLRTILRAEKGSQKTGKHDRKQQPPGS